MPVRIVRQPTGHADGLSLRPYRPGQTYDINPTIANYLIAEDFAILEMRRDDRIMMAVPNVAEPHSRSLKNIARAKGFGTPRDTCYPLACATIVGSNVYFQEEMDRRGAFHNLIVLYSLASQIVQTVACNARYQVEKRCCRWLLIARDHPEHDENQVDARILWRPYSEFAAHTVTLVIGDT